MKSNLHFSVHARALIEEIIENTKGGVALSVPLRTLYGLLQKVAHRASEINDPKLNALMCDLTLYAIADPYDKENYDPSAVKQVREIANGALEK